MERISEIFRKPGKKLSIYFTAGYPVAGKVLSIAVQLQANGVDMLEIGIPYSDPVADGPVIQQSNSVALRNGMNIESLFKELKSLREEISIPVILMGYLNPVLQFGFEEFCSRAAACGVDGLIIPDLPLHEYRREYKEIIGRHNLNFIFLITPATADERIKELDRESSGFLYVVSSSATTGNTINLEHFTDYLKRIRSLDLSNPIMVGFGIHDQASFEKVTVEADGAIIGSAFISNLDAENLDKSIATFVGKIRHKSAY